MNYFFITGTGKGLGKSIAKKLLENSQNKIWGLSRENSLAHPNFIFEKIDLSNIQILKSFSFPEISKANSITLINNAGIIGDIKPIGKKTSLSIENTFTINTISPSLLMNQFIKQFQTINCKKTILNISSGAGRHTIRSWADYCASKSALDMFSIVLNDEQQNQEYPFKVFSVAPGIIDTDMQKEIRSVNSSNFEQLEYFKELKNKNQLSTPSDIAKKIIEIIDSSHKHNEVLLDVRDF